MHFEFGQYAVDVNDTDGAILVKQGDWLSKYSYAVYHNYTTLKYFSRKEGENCYKEIINKELIKTGETIYLRDKNKLPKLQDPSCGIGDPAGKPVDLDKMLDDLQEKAHLPGRYKMWLNKLLQPLNNTGDAAALTEIMTDLEVICLRYNRLAPLAKGVGLTNSVAGLFADAFGFIGIVMFTMDGIEAIVNAQDFGLRMTGLRAIAFAITAWASGDAPPPYPTTYKNMIRTSDPSRIGDHTKVWNDTVGRVTYRLGQQAQNQDVTEESMRISILAGATSPTNLLWNQFALLEKKNCKSDLERDMFYGNTMHHPNIAYPAY